MTKKKKIILATVAAALTVAVVTLSVHALSSVHSANNYPEVYGIGVDNRPLPISAAELRRLVPDIKHEIAKPDLSNSKYREFPLRIEKRDGKYYWASNRDKPLIVKTKTILLSSDSLIRPPEDWASNKNAYISIPETPLANEQNVKFVVFKTVDGTEAIVIPVFERRNLERLCEWHRTRFCIEGCQARVGFNYVEYKLNEHGTLVPYVGRTFPDFPYPKSDICLK